MTVKPRRPPRNLEEYTSLAEAAAFCRQMATDLDQQAAQLPDTRVRLNVTFSFWPGLPESLVPRSWFGTS